MGSVAKPVLFALPHRGRVWLPDPPPPCPSLPFLMPPWVVTQTLSRSMVVPLGGDPSFTPHWGGTPYGSLPLPLSYPYGLRGYVDRKSSPVDFPTGGETM